MVLAHWSQGRRILASATLCLCVAILIVTMFRGLSDAFLVRGAQTVAIAAAAIGAIAIIVAVIGGSGLNVSFMVGLAFAIAASANFPALLLALTWRRFNTTGAVCGVLLGVLSAIFLIIVSPGVWPGADSDTGSPIGWTLANPGIVSIPLGFLGCILGTLLSTERATERTFHELFVRSETGLGSEKALPGH